MAKVLSLKIVTKPTLITRTLLRGGMVGVLALYGLLWIFPVSWLYEFCLEDDLQKRTKPTSAASNP